MILKLLFLLSMLVTIIAGGGLFLSWAVARNDSRAPRGRNPFGSPLIIAAMLLLFSVTGCAPNYSSGSRVGQITKFSQKGIFAKSWEGELLMGGLKRTQDGVVANVFHFSVDPKETNVITSISIAMDSSKPVRLYYAQSLISNPLDFDTTYRITKVEILNN